MALEDGRFLVAPARYDALIADGASDEEACSLRQLPLTERVDALRALAPGHDHATAQASATRFYFKNS
ncbi:hypothetical protein T492DRAFT_854309 [Pavlovales sp. CCMP2436]|nr:hypothetical protein T492DRAFT_854309 [Pavlovales sp. CCMP2436]